MKTFRVPLPIFPYRKIRVITYNEYKGKKKEEALQAIHKKYKVKYDTDYQALSYYTSNTHYVILPEDCATDVLSHEIYHLSNQIMYYTGIRLDHDNDEAQAYIISHLTKYIDNKLKKNVSSTK